MQSYEEVVDLVGELARPGVAIVGSVRGAQAPTITPTAKAPRAIVPAMVKALPMAKA
jgi:hypothetical protein